MIYLYLTGCFVFIILQGFFAATEISVISSSTLKLRYRQERGEKNAGKVYQLFIQPERFLATTLVGINLSLVLSSSILTLLLIHLGLHKSNLWAMLIFTPLVVIFCELIPKNIGRHFKENFNCLTVNIFEFFANLLSPLVNSIETVSKFLINTFVGNVRKRSLFVTKEEIKYLIKEVEKAGGIDKGQKAAIEQVFEFSHVRVKDVRVKLNNLVALDYPDSYEKILETVKKHGFTRYPIFKEKEIIGYVNIYDLFSNPAGDWHSFIRPLAKVEYDQRLYETLIMLKRNKQNIVLVFKDEKPYGIITIQDLIREIITSIIKI